MRTVEKRDLRLLGIDGKKADQAAAKRIESSGSMAILGFIGYYRESAKNGQGYGFFEQVCLSPRRGLLKRSSCLTFGRVACKRASYGRCQMGAYKSVASSKPLSGIVIDPELSRREALRRHKLIALAGQRPALQNLIVGRRAEASH